MFMTPLEFSILGQLHKVSCAAGEEQALQTSLEELTKKIEGIKLTGSNFRNDQLIVMAALTLCHELNLEKEGQQQYSQRVMEQLDRLPSTLNVGDKSGIKEIANQSENHESNSQHSKNSRDISSCREH